MSLNTHYINVLATFSHSLTSSSTNPTPAQQAARRFIALDAAVVSNDLSNFNGEKLTELDELAHKVQEQFRSLKNKNLPRDISQAVHCLHSRMQSIEQEKSAREKREILMDLENRDSESDLSDLFPSLSDHANDRYFLHYVLEKAAIFHPRSLMLHLDRLPPLNRKEQLRIGVFLDRRSDRKRFADHFNIPRDLLEKNRDKAGDLEDAEANRIGSGICLGYTLSNISSVASQKIDLTPKARFVQASYELESYFFLSPAVDLGHKILASIPLFPATISQVAQLLGIQTLGELQAAYQDRTNAIAHVVGRTAKKIIYSMKHAIKECKTELIEHEILRKEIESKKGGSDASFYDEESRQLAQLTSEVAKKKSDFERELGRLEILLGEKMSARLDEVPRPVLKNALKLKPAQRIVSDVLFEHLAEQLKVHLPRQGSCELDLVSHVLDGGNVGHSVYLRANPPAFCDAGDTDPLTGAIRFKEFSTLDEMIDALQQTLIAHYTSALWHSFSLTQYKAIK